ncbi:anaerobic ribonucleoside-triphosphate reductase activating protein [Treponema primitia ZAS-2]|uniref:Anaerobic ribonucleoside-triphosphate reductase-activating protein n=1 Tax=Treponema primitia (strain ATCC BAA-887 / DSM 12427 / ZAS-2) TaxID=545694 RepID=F5YLC9_TREPZ|nr:4Fe-4S single cluster domain-containing protein [Treponema primitia]AEF83549.1 anaerobic ribonucleoside-triphosphate reductase activating protein [Treponema primitia ZAS-2]
MLTIAQPRNEGLTIDGTTCNGVPRATCNGVPRATCNAVPRAAGEILSIGGIEPESIVDGPGFRYTVFVQGCNFRCPGCHNAQLQPFTGGRSVTVGELLDAIRCNPLLDGLTLSGGDPFTQAASCAALAEEVRALGLSVMTYTGYTWEALLAADNPDWWRLIMATDVLVDGPFIRELRNIDLFFRGSSNQRLIDVGRSLGAGMVVVMPGE